MPWPAYEGIQQTVLFRRVSLSLPSLRVGSVNDEMLRELKAVRKSGFTIAPEAGTDRLRAVINKDFTSDTYAQALEKLFKAGWQSLKLYFMIGLPTETDEDITAIPEMVWQAINTSKRLTGRRATLSVGVSPFVPKPHTPFQWYGQNSLELIIEKNRYLKGALLKKGVQFRGHDPEMSLLEAAFARGDERPFSALLRKPGVSGAGLMHGQNTLIWPNGSRPWITPGSMPLIMLNARSAVIVHSPGTISILASPKNSSGKNIRQALSAQFTSDCRKVCHACGLKCRPEDMAQACCSRSVTFSRTETKKALSD